MDMQEIGQFVAANWTQLEDSDAGVTYFYNQITHRTQFDQPIQPQRVRYLLPILPTFCPFSKAGRQNLLCMRL